MGIVLSLLLMIGLFALIFKTIWSQQQKIKDQRIDFADLLKQRRANFPRSVKASEQFIAQAKKLSENIEDFAA